MAGRRPVEEAFVARRKAHRLLVTPQRRQALEKIVLHATSLRIPIVEVEGGTLTAIAGFDGHQGVGLVVEARHYSTPDEILARARERGEPPFVLVLDSLEDPQNVGTLLRSAEAAGVHGVLFPTKRQAPLSPAAVKASAGAVEHLLLAPVDDLAGALADLHIDGLRIVGAEAEAPLTARQADLRGPLALVVGSEGQGLGPAVRRRTDLLVRIPMRGAIGSLNASVAGSILLFEAVAQRDPAGTATVPAAVPEPTTRAKAAKGLTAEPAAEIEVPAPAVPAAPASAAKPGPVETASRAPSASAAKPGKASAAKAAGAGPATSTTAKAPTGKRAKTALPPASKGPSDAKAPAARAPAAKGPTAAKAPAAKAPGAKSPVAKAPGAKAKLEATATTAPKALIGKTTQAAAPTVAKAPTAPKATSAPARAAKPGIAKTTPTRKAVEPKQASAGGSIDDELLPGGPATGRKVAKHAPGDR